LTGFYLYHITPLLKCEKPILTILRANDARKQVSHQQIAPIPEYKSTPTPLNYKRFHCFKMFLCRMF